MTKRMGRFLLSTALSGAATALIVLSMPATAQESTIYHTDKDTLERAHPTQRPYSPWVDRNFPQRPLFGDTHLHTSLSFDAVSFGTTLDAEDAYRFATGEEVTSSTGVRAKIGRPLDFLVVADHAENMGTMTAVQQGRPEVMSDATVRGWNRNLKAGGEEALKPYLDIVGAINAGTPLPDVLSNEQLTRSFWEKNNAAAEKFNTPGEFTAFIGYEWSTNTGGNNLHRVVVFRDGSDKANQVLPFSSIVSDRPEDLWKALETYEEKTGGQILAIPHNANLSNGNMFAVLDSDGNPITREYAQTRVNWEPLMEATQEKGDGEAHPVLSPNDEFADYETWDKGNLDLSVDKTPDMLQYEYARAAQKTGLVLEQKTGVNPFKLGMIGSSDAHTALAAMEEDNWFGKLPHVEPKANRAAEIMMKFGEKSYIGAELAASGYAAVWAMENTREAIFDAMRRREVYATTGPRMLVRLFGGWDFEAEDALGRSPAVAGYSRGVPMGGDLSGAPAGKSPTFLVAALKDPIGANLDRYQVVKGWVDADGEAHERVYDVSWSGDRQPNSDGKLPAVGSTVDAKTATFTNGIGAPELIEVWADPDFDPDQRAFYYGRVLEIPTPRWTTYDAAHFGTELPEGVPTSIQERAYTSPIWYTPAG